MLQQKTKVCPVCRGKRTVKDKNKKTVTCYACRGTGQAKDYATK